METRLSLDIGTNSIGWALLELDDQGSPVSFRRMGVRIFSDGRDPKSKTSKAVDRRLARQARRQRDRFLLRRKDLLRAMIELGLMPASESDRKALETLDPYLLRAKALDDPLTPSELGRALFHLAQRRGFKSNRKTERSAEDDIGVVQASISELRRRMEASKARTLGEYLHRRRLKGKRVRREYTDRGMVETEFDAVIAAQRRFHPVLSDEVIERLRDIIFRQRPLRPVDPGRCTLSPDDNRAPWALLIAQRFRIYQEANNLQVIGPDLRSRALTLEERDQVVAKLERHKEVRFSSLRKLLKLPDGSSFNLESENRKKLLGNQTSAILAKKEFFGTEWHTLDPGYRDKIVEALLEVESEAALIERATHDWGLDFDKAERISRVSLPVGYARIGIPAMQRIVPLLRSEVISYAEAARKAGYEPSDFRPSELLPELPYYGQVLQRHVGWGSGEVGHSVEKRLGRIANPTVHIGLNQVRKLVNAVIESEGQPTQIVVELARDLKLGRQAKIELLAEQRRNTETNDRIADELRKLGQPVNIGNLQRWKLWEELGPVHDRRCVFSGKPIALNMLFTEQIEIEHLLPFAKTLDDSMANKTLCTAKANRDKGDRSPFDAFGSSSDPGYSYDQILERASRLPGNKRWRFAEDAMKRFDDQGGFLARQLAETAYLSRIVREYLTYICEDVRVAPGRLTALLRRKWRLNELLSEGDFKNREDHRQHAIDAAVLGVTDLGLLQRVSRASEEARDRIIAPIPWEGFRADVDTRLREIVVSHRPDHGSPGNDVTSGQLHNDTAYGIVNGPDAKGTYRVVHRKELTGLSNSEIQKIADPALRDRIARIAGETGKLKEALAEFGRRENIRGVRLIESMKGVIEIRDRNGLAFKVYKGDANEYVEIISLPNGKWIGEVVSTFDANQRGFRPLWRQAHRGARIRMRLFKNDLLAIDDQGRRRFLRVVKIGKTRNQLTLADHFEGGALKARDQDREDRFRYFSTSFSKLKSYRPRKISVDVMGRVSDPGSS